MKDAAKAEKDVWIHVLVDEMLPEGKALLAEFEKAKEKLEMYYITNARKAEVITASEGFNFSYKKLKKNRMIDMIPAPLPVKEPTAKAKAKKSWC